MENEPRRRDSDLQSGDDDGEARFREKLSALRPLLRGRAQILLGTQCDAEDAVQETYLRALQSPRRPRLTELSRWLLVILRHTIIDRWRAGKHLARGLNDDQVIAPGSEEEAPWCCFSDEEVREIIDEMPRIFREVLRQREVEGASYQNIANDLCIPLSTVGTRLRRGREHLKARLEKLLRGGAGGVPIRPLVSSLASEDGEAPPERKRVLARRQHGAGSPLQR
jgi:RNA polymerase sigma-70 factor (ECF subfamily)